MQEPSDSATTIEFNVQVNEIKTPGNASKLKLLQRAPVSSTDKKDSNKFWKVKF